MRIPAPAIACAALLLTAACQNHPVAPETKPRASRSSPSPTPSTPAQVSAAIRAALTRQGAGTVKISDHEGSETVTSKLQIDCGAKDPRAAFSTVIPGRGDEPARVKMRIVTSGQDLYSQLLNVSAKYGGKDWYHGKISELDTAEFKYALKPVPPALYLYIANCDQAGLIALFAKDVKKLSRPGTYTCSVNIERAARVADGYAKHFYKYAESIGGRKARLTVWLGRDFLPTKYQISVGDHNVEAARWVVSFSEWHLPPIKLPSKTEIK